MENITVAIAGFNHDDLADGSGKAGISLVCMSMPSQTTVWSTNQNGYYYSTASAAVSKAHKLLTDSILPSLPAELRSVIKTVTKKYDNRYSTGEYTPPTAGMDLWALSLDELGVKRTASGYSTSNFSTLGTKYDLFSTVSAFGTTSYTLPTATDVNGTNQPYWTRHIKRTGVTAAVRVGQAKSYNAYEYGQFTLTSLASRVRFGFCI